VLHITFHFYFCEKEYCSAEEVPATDVQTQLPCDKITALILYIELSSLWRSLVKRQMACCYKFDGQRSYFGPNASFGPLSENEEKPFL
jgi:hypothetical protein